MKQRVIVGLTAAAVFLPILILGGITLHFLAGILAMIAVWETFNMRRLPAFSFEGLLSMLGAFILTVPLGEYFTFLPLEASTAAFALVALILMGGMVLSYPNYSLEDAGAAIGISFYIGYGFQNLINARAAGLDKVLFALFLVWATDIGAYLIGSQLGRRALAPRVSPNKSVEGFMGGIVSALIVSTIFLVMNKTASPYGLLISLPLIVLFSAFAQFGDLVESALKRGYGVKDSGRILPGHGGIFDRFDSLIFVLPLMHFFGLF